MMVGELHVVDVRAREVGRCQDGSCILVKVDPDRSGWLATGAGLAGSPIQKTKQDGSNENTILHSACCQDDRLGQEVAERQLECLIKSQASWAVKDDSQ